MNLEQALSSLSAPIKMRARYDSYIGGEWAPPAEARVFRWKRRKASASLSAPACSREKPDPVTGHAAPQSRLT